MLEYSLGIPVYNARDRLNEVYQIICSERIAVKLMKQSELSYTVIERG